MTVADDADDFTPFGYLQNPAHRARAWGDTVGGNLRTSADVVGVEWAYPVGRDATSRAGLAFRTEVDGRRCAVRADFDALGLTSRHHSVLIVGFDWQANDVDISVRVFLAADDAIAARIDAHNTSPFPRPMDLQVELIESDPAPAGLVHVLLAPTPGPGTLDAGQSQTCWAILGRGDSRVTAEEMARAAAQTAPDAMARHLAADAQFAAHSPVLGGDWPAHWREGLHHDLQTTRLLVQPAGGIFDDIWPTWMAAWPRVVMAEGTLDMLRLAYVEPDLALRAIASLFRNAPLPNVPCVFEGGEYNMVAADGSRCGTSPAWCLPFLNLELLYLRTVDRAWLAALYPFLAAYLEWWLTERVDPAGWLVYRCTWESGEDGNPRLDPTGSGDADISRRVRPVELQATMAHAAGVMAFFAAELGEPTARWTALAADFRDRTRALFDPTSRRYRDWLIDAGAFAEPRPDQPYWGIDAGRFAPQSLTPLLLGEPLDVAEVEQHVSPPWTLWPSWTWTLVESAAAAGLFERVGELALATIDRVYRATTRRELGSYARPLPGSAPEFWPTDWRTYAGNDAYGWGATTANLLLRHLVGIKEARPTDAWTLELTPALPRALQRAGARYSVRQLHYRAADFDLTYRWSAAGLDVALDFTNPCELSVSPLDHTISAPYVSPQSRTYHDFRLANGRRHLVRRR